MRVQPMRLSARESDDRGQATHVAMTLLKTGDFGQIIRMASTKRLPALMRHKAEHMVDRVWLRPNRHHAGIDRNFLRVAEDHRIWASRCCQHMAGMLDRYGVTEIYAVERSLPDVEVPGIKKVNTGDIDIVAYSPELGGTIAVEIKNRYSPDMCSVKNGRAMENAAGLTRWLRENNLPPLVEIVWVFYVPHARNLHVPVATEKPLNYQEDTMFDYFEKRHGGFPKL